MARTDDVTVLDAEPLWRRIHPAYLKPKAGGVGFDVSPAAFRDKTGELSVHIASLTSKERVLAGFPAFSLGELEAGAPRRLGMMVCRDPLPNDVSHALICPAATKGQARQLARECRLVVTIPPAR